MGVELTIIEAKRENTTTNAVVFPVNTVIPMNSVIPVNTVSPVNAVFPVNTVITMVYTCN